MGGWIDEFIDLRHELHTHPELAFEEKRTSARIAGLLGSWGYEVTTGVGGTGVVGTLRRGEGRALGIRADMDALPIEGQTGVDYASANSGVMHACGHDGHTTILLAAARYLADHGIFTGTLNLIFQPAEEIGAGAARMIADGLFERFPCDEIYGLHNQPSGPHGTIKLRPGPIMAAADFFDIHIRGRGAHAAHPQGGIDPIVIATGLAQALQSIVSRNADPLKSIVLSITRISAGSAYNVIPETAQLAGTIRTFDRELRALAGTRMRELAAGFAAAYGAEIKVDIHDMFSVLENAPEQAAAATAVATELLGSDNVEADAAPKMGSEDFADMLQTIPGAYFWVGHDGSVPVHNPGFVLDDKILPIGASMFARIIETRMPVGSNA
jgi:hippurate hydrolase